MSEKETKGLSYNLLISKRFRILRHAIVVLATTILTISGNLVHSADLSISKSNLYLVTFYSIIAELVIVYLNLHLFVPKLLLKKKYIQYFVALLFIVFLIVVTETTSEYYIVKNETIQSEGLVVFFLNNNPIISFLIKINTYAILIMGLTMTVLFKYWILNKDRFNELESIELQSELETLKEKLSPSFLSRMLRRAAKLAKSDSHAASTVLLKLSKILRYQLYDCNRNEVLLTSEIDYIASYLELEREYYNIFNFKITVEGDINHIFVPPLLFLPFIQRSLTKVEDLNFVLILNIQFKVIDDKLQFSYMDSGFFEDEDYSNIYRRFDMLYGDQYSINLKPNKELILQLSI